MMIVNSKSRDFQKGVSLIEVLVALLVLSVGLLGLASLQSNALRFNQGAFLRTQATVLAYDIIDRMRANRIEANEETSYQIGLDDDIPSASADCTSVDCTSAQMAEFDLNEWRTAVNERLPNGTGAVAFTAIGTERIYTVTTRWTSRSVDVSKDSQDAGTDDSFKDVTLQVISEI